MRGRAAVETSRVLERHGAYGNGIEMLLHLRDERAAKVPLDHDGFFDGGQKTRREPDINHRAVNCDNPAGRRLVAVLCATAVTASILS